jgi:hypothetical protein
MSLRVASRAICNDVEVDPMARRIRIIVGILILAISVSLLIWGFAPARRETRIQNISPSEMQLPTPSSFYLDDVQRFAFYPGLDL